MKLRHAASLLLFALFTSAAHAQQYPSRAVRIIVPYPPGAITDAVPRMVADKLRDEWNQPVVVENRPGAGGRIGTEAVAKAAPDGYTLVLGIPDTVVIAPFLFKSMPYDPQRDLTPVTNLARQSYLLIARQDVPVATVADVIRTAKASPGKLRFASWGEGSAGHLSMEMVKSMAAVDLQHIPYKGSAAALLGLLGGEVDMMFAGYSTTLPHIKAGKLKVLARTSANRVAITPDIPTMAESGFQGYEVQAWYGLFAPAQTPRPIVDQIQAAVVRALNHPDVKSRVESYYAEIVGNTPDDFAKAIREEQARWSGLIRILKLSLD
jgi:tripartite-type tricarboxylate transporter receptor subunit TctC